jgi:hypothetical protein
MRNLLPLFLRPRPALLKRLIQLHGLKRRTWARRTPRTPPYAGCYNDPKFWWEGDLRDQVLTFWGTFRGSTFSGEILVGPFDAWRNYCISREGEGHRWQGETGGREAGLPSVAELAAFHAAQPSVIQANLSFDSAELEVRDAGAEVLEGLLSRVADVINDLLWLQDPPLLKAAEAGDLKAVESLLAQGADPNGYGTRLAAYMSVPSYRLLKRPLFEAVRRDDAAMTGVLLGHGAEWKNCPAHPLLIALENRAHRALSVLLEAGFPPKTGIYYRGNETFMPVEHAAKLGDLEAVRLLLEAGGRSGPYPSAALRGARWAARGPEKAEIRRLLGTALAEARASEAGTRPPVNWKLIGRTVAGQAAAASLLVAGIYGSGESPRIAIYGFFFNYLYRLPTLALLNRWLTGPREDRKRLAQRLTRRPNPNRPSFPVTVDTGKGPVAGSLFSYLFVMTVLFGLTLLLVNTADQKIITSQGVLLSELAWAALMGFVWWIQDLFDRRLCLAPGANLPHNLGYNSNETGVAALTVLTGGAAGAMSGSPWPCFVVLLIIRNWASLWEDIRWPADMTGGGPGGTQMGVSPIAEERGKER